MNFTPTAEQAAIVDFTKSTDQSLLINALAGAAKTSTLCLIAQALPVIPTICVAFNKSIAMEMAKRLPTHIESSTLNSLGHRTWGKKLGIRLQVDPDKSYKFLKAHSERLLGVEKKEMGEAFTSLLRASRMAKAQGYIPKEMESSSPFGSLLSRLDLEDLIAAQFDVDLLPWMMELIDALLTQSIADAFSGRIDYDDQIYMSTLFGGAYARWPIVMVDEAQDLSALNHETLKLMVAPDGRLIAVGDPYQSIYAFRGAHHGSMAMLKQTFSMKEMTLSISFRCPQAVVRLNQSRVPHFRWADGAPEGLAERHSDQWSESLIPDGAFVICRNNAPLFSLALRLIQSGRSVKLVGSDIGKGLLALMKKLGGESMPQAAFFQAIDIWEGEQLALTHEARHHGIRDRAECLRVFAQAGATLGAAMTFAELLFASDGKVILMTGHKSKGLETEIVFHLNSFLIPSKFARRAEEDGDPGPMQQERNLAYVINTRAKRELHFISLEDMI